MPAPGEQHLQSGGRTISNPFEEVKLRLSEYTAQEIATLQSRLEKQLGPEYLSSRQGPSGQKVHYVAAEKCIQLANEIFGFNGWSSQIMDVQVDFVDENPTTLKVSLGLSVIVRVTLRDGTFHEDVGYGHMENAKGKAAAFEKAKKEGTTDALKRALRNFGNVLGNCIYDKDYLSKVTKVKAPAAKWDVDKLHRHADFAPVVKKEETRLSDEKSSVGAGTASLPLEDPLDDEYGDFDEADFGVADPDSHPDEVSLPTPTERSTRFNVAQSISNGAPQNQNQSRATNRPQQNGAPQRQQNSAQQSGSSNNHSQAPNSGFQRSHNVPERQQMPPPLQNRNSYTVSAGPPSVVGGRTINQPSRAQTGPPSAPTSPARPHLANDKDDISEVGLPPQGAGFFSARAAASFTQETSNTTEPLPSKLPGNLPAFDPHAESPSIRKTPGVDHRSSKPVGKDGRHVPSASQSSTSATIAVAGGFSGAGGGGGGRGLLEGHRRMIGAPNSPSPGANRNSYKPPTILKRTVDVVGGGGRVPLNDLPANGPIGAGDGPEVKRQRLNS